MLLCHQKGCKSFADIRTVNNIVHSTYRSACEAIGLLGDDKEWSTSLEEASISASSSELRSLFEKHWKLMSDDISIRAAVSLNMSKLHINTKELHNFVLYEVELLLNQCSRSIAEYGLPSLPPDLRLDLANRLIMEEKNYDRESLEMERIQLESIMNSKQKIVYDLITRASYAQATELIFVSGHGGMAKTFLWKAIITVLRARGKIVLAVVSSGIASLLLPSGRTNDAADAINKTIVDTVDGPIKTYHSLDTATPHGNDGGESELLYPVEYLNTLNFPGLPPHALELKISVPSILLRNVNVGGGLYNGTRMIVTQLLSNQFNVK
ncbi:uncharacterized protein [Rutidosis leptorrhynchoides]|uniref:uncharacterized protein n=1 Tax=Rutidosis leptorrhynchoides TaxID=125765 RepID=UPI003A999EA2